MHSHCRESHRLHNTDSWWWSFSPPLANRMILVLSRDVRMGLKCERWSRVQGQLSPGLSSEQTRRIRVNNAGRPPHHRPASDVSCDPVLTSDMLTQPFHGLLQDLRIRAGIEVSAGLHGASAGLQQERNRRITYLWGLINCGLLLPASQLSLQTVWFASKSIGVKIMITLFKHSINGRILLISLLFTSVKIRNISE